MTDDRGIWLHAVTRHLRIGQLAGLTGAGGAPLDLVEAAGLVAVVAPVDLADYSDDALRRNMEDLPWLESVARSHHAVADALARLTPLVPARLATIYRDESGVRAALAQRRADITAALDRVAGRDEWGVKAYAVSGPPPARPSQPGGAVTAGRDYLLRRRAQLVAREETERAAARDADEVHAALLRHADAARRHPPQDRRLSGVADWMVLNASYLVGHERAGDFTELLAGLTERYPAVRLELTGPWPSYSFAAIGDAIGDEEATP